MNPVIMTEALWQMPRGAHADQAWGEGEIQSLGFGFGFRVFWFFWASVSGSGVYRVFRVLVV